MKIYHQKIYENREESKNNNKNYIIDLKSHKLTIEKGKSLYT